MNDNSLLNQAEIDALFSGAAGSVAEDNSLSQDDAKDAELTTEEKDALGEIGNITMGSASTTLSELLGHRVNITSPKIRTCTQHELFNSFDIPFIVIQVEFVEGFQGFNILIMHLEDAMRMASLMMGGDGSSITEEVTDMELSAASEAMNQMIGTASTSLATMFQRTVNISPPQTKVVHSGEAGSFRLPAEDQIVVVSFNMSIGDILETEIMQIMTVHTAREETSVLLKSLNIDYDDGTQEQLTANVVQEEDLLALVDDLTEMETDFQGLGQNSYGSSKPSVTTDEGTVKIDQAKLDMLMDIPLKVSVILGRTSRPIKDVLTFTPGAIVELSAIIDEPVEVLVNGTLVAKGEVVVVNENFGVRITEIISPRERLQRVMT